MILVQTPMRISFFGGGTDFPEFYEKHGGGCVLSTAINKYVYVIVKPRFDKKIRLTYTKAELVDDVKDLKHDIVRECLKHTQIKEGIEIVTIGDVPSGTGLGSSSAVTVGVLKALYAYKGIETDSEYLAETADYILRKVLNHPIGVQDQYISAYGGFKFFDFTNDGVIAGYMNPGKLFEHLICFYTGITREANDILKVQRENISNRIEILQKMKELTELAGEKLEEGQNELFYDDFGKLLNEEWELKKQLGPISNPQIDELYKKGIAAGALGGKLLGAGGGGFLLFYCPNGTKGEVRFTMEDEHLTEMPFEPEPDGTKVILNYRT